MEKNCDIIKSVQECKPANISASLDSLVVSFGYMKNAELIISKSRSFCLRTIHKTDLLFMHENPKYFVCPKLRKHRIYYRCMMRSFKI